MKTILRKIISVSLVVVMIFSCFCLLISNEDAQNGRGYDIVACANEVKELYQSVANEQISAEDVNLELVESQKATSSSKEVAGLNASVIQEYVYSHDDELRAHFSGLRINDGCLVVALCCDSDRCKTFIEDTLKCENVTFIDGVASEYAVKEKLDAINGIIGSYSKSVSAGKASETVNNLMKYHPNTVYNMEDNSITVVFDMDSSVEQAVKKVEAQGNVAKAALSKTESSAYTEYQSVVALFKQLVPGYSLKYSVESGRSTSLQFYTDWRPGRDIFVYSNPDAGTGQSISTGYRAKYLFGSTTYYGFVTTGHFIRVGNAVYISNVISNSNKLGVILNRYVGGKVDAAFIRITNTNYTNSNLIYYTSSQPGVTRPGSTLDGTLDIASVGDTIYKSGAASYLSIGTVASINAAYTINDVPFEDLIQSTEDMADVGDSGAVTYTTYNLQMSAKAVGLVMAGNEDLTVFVKASNIKSIFGPEPY